MPIGARNPDWSMTMRVSIGCNFGALVTPGISVTATIASQMSWFDLISSRHWRYGRPSSS